MALYKAYSLHTARNAFPLSFPSVKRELRVLIFGDAPDVSRPWLVLLFGERR